MKIKFVANNFIHENWYLKKQYDYLFLEFISPDILKDGEDLWREKENL